MIALDSFVDNKDEKQIEMKYVEVHSGCKRLNLPVGFEMLRTALLALFLVFFAVDTNQQSLADLFNKSVDPCDDLYGHVCVDSPIMRAVVNHRKWALFYDLVNVLNRNRTNSFQRIVNATVTELTRSSVQQAQCRFIELDIEDGYFKNGSNDIKIGHTFGQLIAFGRFGPGSYGERVKVFRHVQEATFKYYVTQA
uniref:Peptidase_M13 domain-containing protein n=1 Tax=Steinernema glaseri TaxID=37863 RepID=A0A1I8AFS8_9BILA